MDLQRIVRVLAHYAGRDKFLRAAYAAMIVYSTKIKDPEFQKRFVAFAKQLSAARLVFRQCNHPSMIQASNDVIQGFPMAKDKVDYSLMSAVTGLYTLYGYAEFVAWLADAKLIVADSAKWFRICLYLWLGALACGIVKTVRQMLKKPLEKCQSDFVTLVGFVCDFVSGANGLPSGYLWSGKLTTKEAASLSFIASAIGFWKLY
uniref:Peroxisomal biogenesis factor 11 n=1 Tax=Panagrolaimus sp. JU765 TaxID=591449 RepID=A0AC34RPB9_9BILA